MPSIVPDRNRRGVTGDGRGTRKKRLRETVFETEHTRIEESIGDLEPGGALGPFVILDVLGRGGMGVVYSAFDPRLDRTVALKVIRVRDGATPAAIEQEQTRLLREAQAMARLSHHPNVVTVYEAGTLDGRVYIAMEHIAGTTLRRWRRKRKRSWREIVSVLTAAGRGLAAGHRVGLVHRDFKPDNVLVADDGRVVVIDFGLVRTAPNLSTSNIRKSFRLEDSIATVETNLRFGTADYMSPEQHGYGTVDARTDQFAFCVSLYEMLFRQRPFSGRTYDDLVDEVMNGDLPPYPSDVRVPARIRHVIEQGLSAAPEDRFPSMEPLLARLELRQASSFRTVLACAVGSAALSGMLGATLLAPPPEQESRCSTPTARLTGIWDQTTRQTIHQRFLSTGVPYAETSYQRIATLLDRYSRRWVAQHQEACEITYHRFEQSEGAFDLQMHCLGRALGELEATSQLYRSADAETVRHAVEIAPREAGLAECADLNALRTGNASAPDPTRERLHERLVRLEALLRARQTGADAVNEASDILAEAERLEAHQLIARARHARALLRDPEQDASGAEQDLRAALAAAARAKDTTMAAQIWTELLVLVGHRQARFDEARGLETAAEHAVSLAGNSPLLAIRLKIRQGKIRELDGDFERALTLYEQALALESDRSRPEWAELLNRQGEALRNLNRLDEARSSFERSHRAYARILGPEHPKTAGVLLNLGNLYFLQQDTDRARETLQQAQALLRAALGDDHLHVAFVDINLGEVLRKTKRYRQAIERYQAVLPVLVKHGMGSHPYRAYIAIGLADSHRALGRPRHCLPNAEKAVQILEGGGVDLYLAEARFILAQCLWAANSDPRRAIRQAERAHTALRAAGGEDATERRKEVAAWLASRSLKLWQ